MVTVVHFAAVTVSAEFISCRQVWLHSVSIPAAGGRRACRL